MALNSMGMALGGAQGFLKSESALPTALKNVGDTDNPNLAIEGLATQSGFNLGIIGKTLTRDGVPFGSLGALIDTLHTDSTVNVVLNPKLLVEDNVTAEVFVGENIRFKTQSLSNDEGSVLTNNFEFRDIGSRLKVTPLIGSNESITLQIDQELTSAQQSGNADIVADLGGPNTSKATTTTTVHMPNDYFLILSGMIRDDQTRNRTQVPCLGSIPFLGAAFSQKTYTDKKRNLMIFIHPHIIDTEKDIQETTKRQQDIFEEKSGRRDRWNVEVEQALEFFNLKSRETH